MKQVMIDCDLHNSLKAKALIERGTKLVERYRRSGQGRILSG